LPISDPKVRCKLFDSLVLPILSYASEVWGVNGGIGDAAELLHRQFLKRMLGVRDSTANFVVLLVAELGRLRFHWWRQILRNHDRINNLSRSDDERLIMIKNPLMKACTACHTCFGATKFAIGAGSTCKFEH